MGNRPAVDALPDASWIDLVAIFGSINDRKDWHRISERVSKLNKLARPYGVRLELAKEQPGRLFVRHRAPRQIRRFQSKLSRASGAIQRVVAQELEKRILANPRYQTEKLAEFVKLQLQELPAWIGKPLQFALGLSQEALFIDSPYTLGVSSGRSRSLRPRTREFLDAMLAQEKPFHGLVTAEPGGGKTTLLYSLFQELCRRYLAGEIEDLPILIPASYAEIQDGRLCWRMGALDQYLRKNTEVVESLRLLESANHVIFLVDGLDENPDLIDFSKAEVVKAWQGVLKNRCVASCRSRFFRQHLEGGDLGRKLTGNWTLISLADWRPSEAGTLYRMLAACPITPPRESHVTAGDLKSVFAHLGGLCEKGGYVGRSAFRSTPLNLWLHALFVASNRGLLARNEYELLEFVSSSICRWQAAKKGRVVPLEAMMGLLSRAAWASYSAGQGERRYTKYSELSSLIESQWPALLSRKDAVIGELEAHPILECDPANGLLWIDPHFMDFLAARHLIQTLLLRDFPGAIKQLSVPVLWDVSRYFDEGVDCLGQADRAVVTAALIDSFSACERTFALGGHFSTALALNQIGYHLGKMGGDSGREFLRSVLERESPALKSEMCYWAIVIGLALSGDSSELDRYVKQLEKQPKRFLLNMAYCQIYFLDKSAGVANFESALSRLGPVWNKSCDAILRQLSSKSFKNIQQLDLFSLRRFIDELGPEPFTSAAGQARREALRAILAGLARQRQGDKGLEVQSQRLQKALPGII